MLNLKDSVLSVSAFVKGCATEKFNGPIIVNSKMTVNSDDGIEANTLFLQGDATVSRNYTVGVSAPVLAGNPGNVIWKANPSQGGTWGYVYTTDNAWRAMGPISLSKELSIFTFDQLGIATNTPGLNLLQVGSGTSLFAVDEDGVGIGTTANGTALRVIGDINIPSVPQVGGLTQVFRRSNRRVKVTVLNNYRLILKPKL